MRLAIDQILVSDKTRTRAHVDESVVNEYAMAMKNGAVFPAITVFAEQGSSRYFLAGGEHRLLACQKADPKKKTVGVDVKQGGLHEALHFALSSNNDHGLRRSNADKNKAVTMALADAYYDDWSLRQVGELCQVSHNMVKEVKQAQIDKLSSDDSPGANNRPTKKAPTQLEVDLKLLRGALAVIKAFPYSGKKLSQRLGLTPDDEKDLQYVEDWIRETHKK